MLVSWRLPVGQPPAAGDQRERTSSDQRLHQGLRPRSRVRVGRTGGQLGYCFHPQFACADKVYDHQLEHVEGDIGFLVDR